MRRERTGSVLVEALIATAIVAMVLVGVLRVIGDSVARNHHVEQRRTALMVARSQMAAVGFSTPLVEGEAAGVAVGDYAWRTNVERCPEDDGPSVAGGLYCVTVTVRAPGTERPAVILRSRRLRPEA